MVDTYAKLMFDLDIQYHTPLPPGAKILAANHPTTVDPFLVLKLASEPVHILIDETLFKVPTFGRYLRTTGHVRVIPGSGRSAFQAALELLQAGETVAIYPEGAISPLTGGVHPLKTGVARLALMTGAPVIPVGIHLDRARIRLIETPVDGQSVVGTWYFGGPYAMTVGDPLYRVGDVNDRAYVGSISEHIRQHILALAAESARRVQPVDAVMAMRHTTTSDFPIVG